MIEYQGSLQKCIRVWSGKESFFLLVPEKEVDLLSTQLVEHLGPGWNVEEIKKEEYLLVFANYTERKFGEMISGYNGITQPCPLCGGFRCELGYCNTKQAWHNSVDNRLGEEPCSPPEENKKKKKYCKLCGGSQFDRKGRPCRDCA